MKQKCSSEVPNHWAVAHSRAMAYLELGRESGWLECAPACVAQLERVAGWWALVRVCAGLLLVQAELRMCVLAHHSCKGCLRASPPLAWPSSPRPPSWAAKPKRLRTAGVGGFLKHNHTEATLHGKVLYMKYYLFTTQTAQKIQE